MRKGYIRVSFPDANPAPCSRTLRAYVEVLALVQLTQPPALPVPRALQPGLSSPWNPGGKLLRRCFRQDLRVSDRFPGASWDHS